MACHQLLENEHVQTQDSLQGRVGKTKGWSPGGQFLILTIVSAWTLLGLNEKEISTEAQRCKRIVKGSKRLTFCRSQNPVPPTLFLSLAFHGPMLPRVFCSHFDSEPSRPQRLSRCFTGRRGESLVLFGFFGNWGADLVGIWASVSILSLTVQRNGHSLNRPGH